MTNERFDVSRRKMLGALGTIGGAAALGGASTMAFFSDEENFANNELVAGELDLKVDWEEHYSDWSDDEDNDRIDEIPDETLDPDANGDGDPYDESGDTDDLDGDGENDFEVLMDDPNDPAYTGFPTTAPDAEKSLWVFNEYADDFMANTAIEAFPDTLDPNNDPYDAQRVELDDQICDIDADLDGALDSEMRTRGTFPTDISGTSDANPQTTGQGDPLVNITDVKPGDFGEVTFSFHLCGNPGFVWLTGELVDASENGVVNNEADDEDEDQVEGSGNPDLKAGDDPNQSGKTVELLNEIRAAMWYDTGQDGVYGATIDDKDAGEGDNIFGTGETLIPLQGSLRSVLNALEQNMFPLDAEPISTGGGGGGGGGGGSTATTVSEIINESTNEISNIYVTTVDTEFTQSDKPGAGSPRNWTCADFEELLPDVDSVVGSEVLNPDTAPIKQGANYAGCTTITVNTAPNEDGDITLSSSSPVLVVSIKGGPNGEQVYVFSEPVILDEATFTTPGNHGLSNVDVCCPVNGDGPGAPGAGDGARQCFEDSTTAYIGFEWWLPVDHANEIQTDSVAFDLGFYTEQCRHNDGSGISNT